MTSNSPEEFEHLQAQSHPQKPQRLAEQGNCTARLLLNPKPNQDPPLDKAGVSLQGIENSWFHLGWKSWF